MDPKFQRNEFSQRLADIQPDNNVQERLLAFYSVAVASADDDLMTQALGKGQSFGITRAQFYEIVLQSYLFLGFPRMLSAAITLDTVISIKGSDTDPQLVLETDLDLWRERGDELCRRIYAASYKPLKTRVQPIAPEIFDWMVTEGYGKVLSRPGLPIVTRELSIVAFLMAENRPSQLHSHMRGVLNVGGSLDLLETIVEDLGSRVGEGYKTAMLILPKLEIPECNA